MNWMVKDQALREAIADAFESEKCYGAYNEIVDAVFPDPYRDDQWERLHRIMEKIRAAVLQERPANADSPQLDT